MKITVLASGSKGNSTLIETKNHNILIDAGISLKELQKRLEKDINIDTLIITHIHSDHIKGLKSIYKKYKPTIYTKSEEIIQDYSLNPCEDCIMLDDIEINIFNLSHDVSCIGLNIKEFDKELIYITDTGYLNQKILKKIADKDIYILESNHDVDMLMHGRYPFNIKQRILSDKGHLSNKDANKYLKKLIGDHTSYIVLAHISEENNTEDLVYEEINKTLNDNNKVKIYIAKQQEKLETIEV